MARITKTTSGRWEVKGAPEKWKSNSAEDWESKSTGDPDLRKIQKWIEEMQEWSEMMHEAVIELREKVRPIPGIEHELAELGTLLVSNRKNLKPGSKRKKRPPA